MGEEKGLVSKSEAKVEKETKGVENPDSNSEQYKPKHHRFDDENDSDSNQNLQDKEAFNRDEDVRADEDDEESKSSLTDAQGKQKYQPPNRSWMARHKNRRRKSVDEEEDYDFKTKRQIVNEFEFAPETEENLDTLEDFDEERVRLRQENKEREKKQKQVEL